MKIIGLTGNSGCGKSTVSDIFSKNGGHIIDADKIAHENMEFGKDTYNEIVDAFGSEILLENGEIDRKKLGRIVFSDKEKLSVLNEISLKYILEEINKRINGILENPKEYKYIVIDAPLLIETGLNMIVNEVWVVCADFLTKVDRIVLRDKISPEDAKRRLQSQTNQDELINFADIVIDNDNVSLFELEREVLSKLSLGNG